MNEEDEDRALAEGLQRRDGGFLWRLALRFTVIALLVVWLFLSESGSAIGRWAANGFGSLTGN
ncbi:MAG: hypothetical protein AAF938_15425 [Myxococcota bacterium]